MDWPFTRAVGQFCQPGYIGNVRYEGASVDKVFDKVSHRTVRAVR